MSGYPHPRLVVVRARVGGGRYRGGVPSLSRHASVRPRALRASAALAALALLVTGCVAGKQATPVSDGGPTHSSERPANFDALLPGGLDPAFREYYAQQVTWDECIGGSLECATVSIPVSWRDASLGSVSLEVVRSPALGERTGSILVNPGGPGGSGIDFIETAVGLVSRDVRQEYDLVSFDPRGVGRSTPVECVDDSVLDVMTQADHDLRTAEGRASFAAEQKTFADGCLERTGTLLGNVDTASAAHDMDLLRVLVRDEQLHYLGYSYGTQLGAAYAGQFPDKVGRLVLDAAVDITQTSDEASLGQAKGFELALRNYVTACQSGPQCPLTGDVDSGLQQIHDLTERALADPLPTDDDARPLTRNLAFYGIAVALYSDDSWPYLTGALRLALVDGDGTGLLQLADMYNDRKPDGTFGSNSFSAFRAVGCADSRGSTDLATMEAERLKILEVAPTLGESFAFGGLVCADWPTPVVEIDYDISAKGAAPIVVIGTTGDPATPYESAEALAGTLESATLLTWEGEGHTAYGRSNSCIKEAVDAYFLEGTVPAEGLVC